jgi:hypothetical protein
MIVLRNNLPVIASVSVSRVSVVSIDVVGLICVDCVGTEYFRLNNKREKRTTNLYLFDLLSLSLLMRK